MQWYSELRIFGKVQTSREINICDCDLFVCDTGKTKENFTKMMNDAAALAGMINPYDTIGLYEQPKPRFIFKMPRVVPDQKSKFESDELFRRLGRESEVSQICYMV